jgi:catechol-2,3-dioxygenase
MKEPGVRQYDRSAEDVGNIVALEHVNLGIADQGLATVFYMSGLGLTRDPYMMTSIDNMWVNVGRSQFHLPTMARAQRLRGRVGLVIPDRESLLQRLGRVKGLLGDTRFAFVEHDDHVETTCPWGNRIRCHGASSRFDGMALGMAYVEFDVPHGSAEGIASFYRDVFSTGARVERAGGASAAHVSVGIGQELIFRESDAAPEAYDGHHIQVYVVNFSGPYRGLLERGLLTEESNQHQYRFQHIADPATGKALFEIEHEVRSLRHPMHARPLVNRNPRQSNRAYVPGRDGWVPEPMGSEMDDPRVEMRRKRFEEASRRAAG